MMAYIYFEMLSNEEQKERKSRAGRVASWIIILYTPTIHSCIYFGVFVYYSVITLPEQINLPVEISWQIKEILMRVLCPSTQTFRHTFLIFTALLFYSPAVCRNMQYNLYKNRQGSLPNKIYTIY